MKEFILEKNIFMFNTNFKKMDLLSAGKVMIPRLQDGNECYLTDGKIVYKTTIDIFKLFFVLLEESI